MPIKIPSTLHGRTIRCILFDFGDTLWTRIDKTLWYQLESIANQRAVALLHLHTPPLTLPTLNDVMLGDEIRKVIERAIRDKKRQDPEHEPDFIRLTQEALQHIGIIGIDLITSEAIFEALRVPIRDSRILFDDLPYALSTLKERGYTLGIVTNRHYGGVPFQHDLQVLGLYHYFDPHHMAISADLSIRKPNPAIFLHALHGLGFTPEEAAMVGDSLTADVAGAKRLNIFAIWKPKPHLIAEAKAARSIMSTLALTQQNYNRAQTQLTKDPTDLPLAIDSLDENYLISYARSRESKRKQAVQLDTKPDLIIEHLSDLLAIFPEVTSS